MAREVISHEPLVRLATALGVSEEALAGVERPGGIHHAFDVGAEHLLGLPWEVVAEAMEAYASALSLKFQVGDYVELELTDRSGPDDLVAFQEHASGSYTLVLRLDKAELPVGEAIERPSTQSAVFFFGDALVRLLRRGSATFEQELWPSPEQRLLILVLDDDVRLVGEWLAIIGGSEIASLQSVFETAPPSPELTTAQTRARDRYIGWDVGWVSSMTPRHLRVQGSGRDQIVTHVHALFARLAVLFVCDRARARARDGKTPEVRAEFRGQAHVAVVPMDEELPLTSTTLGSLDKLYELVEWCYAPAERSPEPQWLSDRLPFVQTRVAQTLEGRPEEDRFDALLSLAPYLFEGLEWHWKAFVEGRVSDYLDRVKDLEVLVSTTTGNFADQAAALVKDLSDAMLAAVAVLVGSFIAATFEDSFNGTLFRLGMLSYALYVFLFPCVLSMRSNQTRFELGRQEYIAQRRAYEETLFREKVSEIEGERIEKAESAYSRWFTVVRAAYTGVVLAAVVAACAVPDVIG